MYVRAFAVGFGFAVRAYGAVPGGAASGRYLTLGHAGIIVPMTEEPAGPILFPRLGNWTRTLIVKHKCWRDRIPWYGRRHVIALCRKEGLL